MLNLNTFLLATVLAIASPLPGAAEEFVSRENFGALPECLDWKDVTTAATKPDESSHHAMVYDSCRGVIVDFGGFIGTTGADQNETWEWNCGTRSWTKRADLLNGPAARHSHSMAFDSNRCVVVLFGGSHNSASLNDTWEYDGTHWLKKCATTDECPTVPLDRIAHGMAYDSVRNVTVLFGGHRNGADIGETWEWDGTTWTAKNVGGPSSREYPAMAFDPSCQQTVLFGGQGPGGYQGDTWLWDGNSWTNASVVPGPSPRYGAAMSYDSSRQRIVMFGGNVGSTGSNETWERNCATGLWALASTSLNPTGRFHAGMAFASACEQTILFGGWVAVSQRLNDTWTYSSAPERDCNRNGVRDSCDIRDHTSLDANEDGVPDECELPPTQSVVLDFSTEAPFQVGFANQAIPNLAPFVGESTPIVNQADKRLQVLLHEPNPDKEFDDFKQDILGRVREEYSDFRVEFVLNRDDASLPPSQQATVYFSGPGPPGLYGTALWYNVTAVDVCNINKMDSAIVFLALENYYPTYSQFLEITTNTVVHEVGHLLGLLHTCPHQTQKQHMLADVTSDDRVFVGVALQTPPTSEPCSSPLTQNDKAALALSVGTYPWVEAPLGPRGTLDGVCFLARVILEVNSTTSLYGLKALACSPPDACRLVEIGDVPAGERRSVEVGLGPGELLTVTGSSLPFEAVVSGTQPLFDVFAYFGSPKGNALSDLDPSLFTLTLDAVDLQVLTQHAVLLQTDGSLVETVGGTIGTASQTGDLNLDAALGADDFRILANCLEGSGATPIDSCFHADLDGDQDVDLRDLSFLLDIISSLSAD